VKGLELTVICEQCGQGFIPWLDGEQFCSTRCERLSRAATCANCGKEFISWPLGKRFCSAECAAHANTVRPKAHLNAVCKHCGIQFHPKSKERDQFCSRECAYIAKAKRPPFSKIYPTVCVACGKSFIGKRIRTRFCSRKCELKYGRDTCREQYRQENKSKHTDRVCPECGVVFNPDWSRGSDAIFCDNQCSKRHGAHIGKAARRARIKGLPRESVDPLEVFKRDGWRCHLCGKKTPRSKRGTRDQRAPELDHIVPIAAGGSHTYDNVACCCRACNTAKAAKPLGQGRLL